MSTKSGGNSTAFSASVDLFNILRKVYEMKIYSKRLDKDGNLVLTSRKMKWSDMVLSLLGLMIGLIMIFPIFYSVTGGLKNDFDFNQVPPVLIPKAQNIVLQNFTDELLHPISINQYGNSYYTRSFFGNLSIPRFPRFLLNSIITACMGTLIRLMIATLAAFSFAFFKFKGNKILFCIILITAMMPSEILFISNFMTIERMTLIDSYLGVMIVDFVSAISIFLLRQRFMSFAKDLREAAQLDGCGNLKFLFKICVPTAKPIYIILCTASFIEFWNSYLWPLLVTNKEWMRTISVGVTLLNFREAGSASLLFAALGLSILPLFIVVCILQRKVQSSFDFALLAQE